MKRIIHTLSEKWPEYLLEVLVIASGIFGAFLLNNWNEERKQENLTQKLFAELHESIRSDTVGFNYEYDTRLKYCLESAQLLKKHIEEDLPYSEGLDTALAQVYMIRSVESNYDIFNRITNVGIETIKNDSLKNELIHYYRDSRQFVSFSKDAKEVLKDLYPKYFVSHEWGKSAKPQNFEELKNTNEFRVAIDYTIRAGNIITSRTEHRKALAYQYSKNAK